ncbi:hypothetical protein [Bifidobacterium castoris]|nr:hypothetical protein [Bifidobacterium castoris]
MAQAVVAPSAEGIIMGNVEAKCYCSRVGLDGSVLTIEFGVCTSPLWASIVTATRILLAGPFASAFWKRKSGGKRLSVIGPDFAWVAKAGMKHIPDAIEFSTDAYAESMYEGDTIGMAGKLNVMPWAVETFRERLDDNPGSAV